jgi:hypothetical protein
MDTLVIERAEVAQLEREVALRINLAPPTDLTKQFQDDLE